MLVAFVVAGFAVVVRYMWNNALFIGSRQCIFKRKD